MTPLVRLSACTADNGLILVTPDPALAGFNGAHERMVGRFGVRRCMTVRRRFAASGVAAGHAKTQVYPLRADPDAFLAIVFVGGGDESEFAVSALHRHGRSPFGSCVGAVCRAYLAGETWKIEAQHALPPNPASPAARKRHRTPSSRLRLTIDAFTGRLQRSVRYSRRVRRKASERRACALANRRADVLAAIAQHRRVNAVRHVRTRLRLTRHSRSTY
jgi:hypothetical protein